MQDRGYWGYLRVNGTVNMYSGDVAWNHSGLYMTIRGLSEIFGMIWGLSDPFGTIWGLSWLSVAIWGSSGLSSFIISEVVFYDPFEELSKSKSLKNELVRS